MCVWTSFAKDLFLWETASSNLDKGGEEQMWNVHGAYKLSLGFFVSMVNESTAAQMRHFVIAFNGQEGKIMFYRDFTLQTFIF